MSGKDNQRAMDLVSAPRDCVASPTGGQCITCSDVALPATVLRIDQASGLAMVTIEETTEEIDITLVDTVAPGDVVLVHGGVAIALLGEAGDE